MEIARIVGFALIAAVLSALLREQKPVFSMLIGATAGVIIFLRLLDYLAAVLQVLTEMVLQANISLVYLNILLKVMGIAYLAEFGARVCEDAGEGVIAAKVEFAGKLLILFLAVPLLKAVLETILQFIP
ncbi:MAG: stage III sporulation protein AD [Firmicutes bacterium]|nr:stage III sporulation protein AD [Bacillota bacterium]